MKLFKLTALNRNNFKVESAHLIIRSLNVSKGNLMYYTFSETEKVFTVFIKNVRYISYFFQKLNYEPIPILV